jgi:pyruvate/2-oxoglutarate dehydrogenase complex dihydrolipoamide acyltransferase (E2) component
MKMESVLPSPVAGVVLEVLVSEGQLLKAGQLVYRLEPTALLDPHPTDLRDGGGAAGAAGGGAAAASVESGAGTGVSESEVRGDWSGIISGIHERRQAALTHGAAVRKNGRLTIRRRIDDMVDTGAVSRLCY